MAEQLTTDELSKLRDMIGKPSMPPPPKVEDEATEAVYRSCVHKQG